MAASPAIVQQRLRAPEIRVYVVGRRLFAFRVISELLDYREERLRLHYHALAAAVGFIVDLPVFIVRIVAKVVDAQGEQAVLLRAPHDTLAQWAAAHFWKDRDDVDEHLSGGGVSRH